MISKLVVMLIFIFIYTVHTVCYSIQPQKKRSEFKGLECIREVEDIYSAKIDKVQVFNVIEFFSW